MVRIQRQLGFRKRLVVDFRFVPTKHDKGIRRAGGLCLLWSDELEVELQYFSDSHIDVVIGAVSDSSRWRFTGLYGQPKVENRYLSWSLLRTLSLQGDLPWVVGGDFNKNTSREDKEGRVLHNLKKKEGLTNALDVTSQDSFRRNTILSALGPPALTVLFPAAQEQLPSRSPILGLL
ncbi:hypothetical protein ACLB2K_020223 [Fragaria x ananassa]